MKKQFKTYLCGPIGVIPEKESIQWRDDITNKLKEMGIESLNPMGRFGGDRLGKIRNDMQIWNEEGNMDAIRENSSKIIIPPDLKMVEDADFITVWIPKKNRHEIAGTYGEVTLAFYLHKPVYVITERSLIPNELSQWLIGCSTKIFISWGEYLNYIKIRYCG